MPTIEETVARIVESRSWDQRIAQIRLIPQRHGTGEQPRIYAEIARFLYVPHLAPYFAYIHEAEFYDRPYFEEVFGVAARATEGFSKRSEAELAKVISRRSANPVDLPDHRGAHERRIRSLDEARWRPLGP